MKRSVRSRWSGWNGRRIRTTAKLISSSFILLPSAFCLPLPVVHPQYDHAPCAGQDLLRVGAAVLVAGQPGHVAGPAIGQPLAKFGGMRGRDASSDATKIETEFLGERGERGFHASESHENARRASAINAVAVISWASAVVSRVN